ncbi:MAG: hypothetical protein FJ276_04470 [Planctomycetes bacterium]|nr:hypothetical protein [Planctomycetota bacterium]
MKRVHWLPFVLVGLAWAHQAGRAEGESSPPVGPVLEEIRAGLGGKVKVGQWAPVRVAIRGGSEAFSGQVELIAPDGDGTPARFTGEPGVTIDIAPHARWHGWRYVKLGRIGGRVLARLRSANGRVLDEKVVEGLERLDATSSWIVTAGADVGADQAARLLARQRNEKPVTSVLGGPEEFPDRWYGYEGVNVLVLPCGAPGPVESLSDEQFEALRRWMLLGGRMVLAAGGRAGELFGAEHRFHELRPGTFEELADHWKASGLENFAQITERLPSPEQIPLAVFADVRGQVVCYEGAGGANDRPLVTRYPFGFGQITYLALDLDRPPLSDWGERARLVARLLRLDSDQEDTAGGGEGLGKVTRVGFDDLTGQLRAALDRFSGVTLVRFSWVAALLVVYILLLGPADFLGLRRIRRPHWTWLTFPIVVLAFSLLAIGLAHLWKGNDQKVNHVEIVDVDVEQALVRGTDWANLYSPRAATLDVHAEPAAAVAASRGDPRVLISWQGLAGTGLGGMNTASAAGVLSDTYAISSEAGPQQARIRGLPVHTSSTKGIVVRWWNDVEPVGRGTLSLADGNLLVGELVNPLDVPLAHCAVYHGNRVYRLLEDLAPRETIDLETAMGDQPPLALDWQLTRRQLVGSADVNTQWDREDVSDVPRILELLMFHGAAGGRKYSQLSHAYQEYVDLSQHLQMGRAILVGRGRVMASRLSIDGAPVDDRLQGQWVFYRIVIPVSASSPP